MLICRNYFHEPSESRASWFSSFSRSWPTGTERVLLLAPGCAAMRPTRPPANLGVVKSSPVGHPFSPGLILWRTRGSYFFSPGLI